MTDPEYLAAFSGWLRVMGEDVLSLANLLDEPEAPATHRRAAAEALQGLSRLVELIPEGIEPLGYLEGAFAFRVLAERAVSEQAVSEQAEAEPAHFEPAVADTATADATAADATTGDATAADAAPADATAADVTPADVTPADVTPADVTDPTGPEPAPHTRAPSAAEGRISRLAADAVLVAKFLGDDAGRFRDRWLSPEATTRAGRAASELLDDEALRHEVQRESREWVEHYHAPELGDGPEELVKIGAFFRTRLRPGE